MTLKLRLFLFFLERIRKPFNPSIPPHKLRAINAKRHDADSRIIDYPDVQMAKVEDREIEMRDGVKIPIRIYQPTKSEGLPIISFMHGGGFVLRNIITHDKACRRIAKHCEAVVVSIGYRLAPEAKFPIPSNDCYDATLWVAENADSIGGDPNQLIVMGDSAGGNLATVTAIQAREIGTPKIAKQVLIYPTTDARLDHPSIEEFAEGYFLTKELMQWFLDHYKSKPADIYDPLMSPLLHPDLSNLPPAFITTAGLDPLKDEGRAYADLLQKAGNEMEYKDYPEVIHGFLNMPRIMKESEEMVKDIGRFVKE